MAHMTEIASPLIVSHPHPPGAGVDRSNDWAAGITFEDFLPTTTENAGLWEGVYRRATIPDEMVVRVAALSGAWRLLILSADWCGDASNIVPVIQRLVEASPNLDLRLLDRDENLGLMDEHLTGGAARAIPTIIILNETNIERAWWGPRPAELQAWVKTEGHRYESDDRYREIRKWYARDKGRSSLEEVIALLESTSTSASDDASGTDARNEAPGIKFQAPTPHHQSTSNALPFPLITARDHIRGPDDAEVTLLQYGDFECPQSRQVFVMVRGLMKLHPEQVRLVFRHFPVRTHPNALAAAEVAESAGSQGAFWEMHDRLFSNQLALTQAELFRHAESIGIDAQEVRTALSEEVFRDHVLVEKRGAVKAGVRSSLNLIVEGVLYEDDAVMEAIGELDDRLS